MNLLSFQYYFNNNYFRIYKSLFPDKRSEKEAEFLIKFIPNKESSVLDLGCAWGRHLKELARMGYKDLTGVDFSEELLKKAQHNLKDFPAVNFVHSDFVSFNPGKKFDLIFHIFQAFGHEDKNYDQRTVNNAARLLTGSGTYLLDLRNPYKMLKNEKFDFPSNVKADSFFDPKKKRERFTYFFDGQKEQIEFNVYTKEEMGEMFKKAGLEVVHVYGGFDGNDYREVSERLILVGKKIK